MCIKCSYYMTYLVHTVHAAIILPTLYIHCSYHITYPVHTVCAAIILPTMCIQCSYHISYHVHTVQLSYFLASYHVHTVQLLYYLPFLFHDLVTTFLKLMLCVGVASGTSMNIIMWIRTHNISFLQHVTLHVFVYEAHSH